MAEQRNKRRRRHLPEAPNHPAILPEPPESPGQSAILPEPSLSAGQSTISTKNETRDCIYVFRSTAAAQY